MMTGCASPTNELRRAERPPVVNKHAYSIRPNDFQAYQKRGNVSSSGNIWERLIALYQFPEVENERINQEIAWFLDHRGYLDRVQERAEPYLHLILQEIEAKNIPGELALLPVVESAFQPQAKSPAKASGLWQFIPATGRLYGLKQNQWYDGRQDVYASTRAATQYLKDLGEEFDGDWFLALASYNWGKGNVKKSIERNNARNLSTDYWSLSMPNETAAYVPRLLAIARIIANPDSYNLTLRDIPDEPYCEVVRLDAGAHLDFNKAAQLADISVDELIRLNPGFKQWRTTPQAPNRLLIPVDRADVFKENLAQLPPEALQPKPVQTAAKSPTRSSRKINTQRYTVQKGDTFSLIARTYKVSIKQLQRINPNITRDQIRIGQTLNVPAQAIAKNPTRYTVKAGDSLISIAKRFKTNVKSLAHLNGLDDRDVIKIGQTLKISGQGNRQAAKPAKVHYTVRAGDSLFSISRKFNVSVNDLKRWNTKTTILHPGQTLTVRVGNAT
ncbi:MAG: LysM peptidoglycan-binding domain-containing protein [Methylococcales bacterium]|nr:LysM peptidoglycan-binding domain-containing protein [Methylococcales bacterium]